jgi:hypothetical protein
VTRETTDPTPPKLARAHRDLLLKLARGPTQRGFADTALAHDLVALGLARIDSCGAKALYFEITPVGRQAISLSGASQAPIREAPRRRHPPLEADLSEHRAAVETVAKMQTARWSVATCCLTCNSLTPIDLDLLAWRRGGRTVLWDRATRCLRPGCGGDAPYQARLPGRSLYQPLSATSRSVAAGA